MTLTKLKAAELPAVLHPSAPWSLGWLLVILFAFGCILAQDHIDWVARYPDRLMLPIDSALNALMDWVVANFEQFFKAITALLSAPMQWTRGLLEVLPWSVFTFVMAAIAFSRARHRTGGIYCPEPCLCADRGPLVRSHELLCAGVHISASRSLNRIRPSRLGICIARVARRFIYPLLDIAQTIPAFAYLLPILLLFGFGPVVGLVASILFAFPPDGAQYNLGAGTGSFRYYRGRTDVWCHSASNRSGWFDFRTALRQLLIGVNQTTMASLSMVIVASIIGLGPQISVGRSCRPCARRSSAKSPRSRCCHRVDGNDSRQDYVWICRTRGGDHHRKEQFATLRIFVDCCRNILLPCWPFRLSFRSWFTGPKAGI